MRHGAYVLIALGIGLYLASWLLMAPGLEAGSHQNPAVADAIATTETPGVARAIGGFEQLVAFSAAASGPGSFGTP